MINTIYRLSEARKLEVVFDDMELGSENAIVRPTHLSICNADMRYYLGTRDAKIMAKKLPMVLIHEGVGEVVSDATDTFKPGEKVVMVPNIPKEENDYIAENYLYSSKFCGSTANGFLQKYISISPKRLVALPKNINMSVAAFTEIVSVAVHAIARFDKTAHMNRRRIGIWGDGNLGYIIALLLKKFFPQTKVFIFGKSNEKLSFFTFADGAFHIDKIPKAFWVDHAFECVGGKGSFAAVEQIIDTVLPEATVSILGVSEYHIPINTRMILEKGLHLFGSSRSGVADFKKTVELYEKWPEIIGFLERIVNSVNPVSTVDDITAAFEKDAQKSFGKTIMKLEV